jgi:hypothetical protein
MKQLFILITSFLISFSSFSQDVKKISQEYIKAMGGIESLKKLENISIESTILSNNYEIPQKTIVILNKGFYQQTTFPNKKMIVAVKDNKGWQINPYVASTPVDLTPQEVQMYIIQSRYLAPLFDYSINGENSYVDQIKLDGEKEIDKDKCYKLLVTYKSKFIETIYISKKTAMIRKIENDFGTTTYYNFKKIKGIMVAQNIESVNKMGTMTTEVLSVKINQKIDFKEFEKS